MPQCSRALFEHHRQVHLSHIPAAVVPDADTAHILRQSLERGTVTAKRMPQLMWLNSTRPRALDCRELGPTVRGQRLQRYGVGIYCRGFTVHGMLRRLNETRGHTTS